MTVVRLFPVDFPYHLRSTMKDQPLATLWRAELSSILVDQFGVSGLERIELAGDLRWVNQRWLCRPLSAADAHRLAAECERDTWRR